MKGFDVWQLLAGLGIFLFGMFLLEESIKELSGRSFKRFIKEYTTGKIRSIFTGISATSFLQSSSAVSLMVLAFVGAGIMSMENAIGVILGSNIGTTVTAWVVAIFGFKINIESFALPLIGIGGLGLIFFNSSPRFVNISKLIVGFGFLFMGLDYMKASMDVFTDSLDVHAIPKYGVLYYLAIGAVITAATQSSSVTIALVLTALNIEIISFNSGAAMVIGANIGTTVTILLGAINGIPAKKRVAFSHFVFNLSTGLIALVLLPFLVNAIGYVVDIVRNAVIGLALFHTVFNLLGVLLFIPFISVFARLLTKIFPDEKTEVTLYINKTTPEIPEAALSALRKETLYLIKSTMRYQLRILNIEEDIISDNDYGQARPKMQQFSLEKMYNRLKLLQAALFTFASDIQLNELSEIESTILQRYLHAARLGLHSAKILKDIKHNFDDFEDSENLFLNEEYRQFRKRLKETYENIDKIILDDGTMNRTEAIIKISRHLIAHDKHFLKSTTAAISKKSLRELDVSTAILVNRAFVQSSRQVLRAIQELFLNQREMELFETVQDISHSLAEDN